MSEPTKFPFPLSPKTRVTVPVALICTLGLALIMGTWKIAQLLNGISKQFDTASIELSAIRKDINTAAAERWRADDMERWTYAFDRLNKDKGIILPNPRDPMIRVRENSQ